MRDSIGEGAKVWSPSSGVKAAMCGDDKFDQQFAEGT
jgi:hypothetical protein